jgi:2-oxoglutarate ferredoxin oxidoreductase subunit delta
MSGTTTESSKPTAAPTAAETPQKRKGPRGQVIVYGTWCKGCGICVAFCPPQVLALDEDQQRPIVVAPEKCTACHFCDTHCPDLAIVVKNIEA